MFSEGATMSGYPISARNQMWVRNSILAPLIDTYINYLISLGYSGQSIRTYAHSVAHFAYWLGENKISLERINESTANVFLFKHLPCCECSKRCCRTLFNVRAALKHLLLIFA